jgi:hypothetical protein
VRKWENNIKKFLKEQQGCVLHLFGAGSSDVTLWTWCCNWIVCFCRHCQLVRLFMRVVLYRQDTCWVAERLSATQEVLCYNHLVLQHSPVRSWIELALVAAETLCFPSSRCLVVGWRISTTGMPVVSVRNHIFLSSVFSFFLNFLICQFFYCYVCSILCILCTVCV